MREIEIKARVHDKAHVLAALEKLGAQLSKPTKQHDVVYSRPGATDGTLGENWLRIRTEDDSTIFFTLKRSAGAALDSIEHETIVENATELTAIITYLGYEVYSDLTKVRQKAQLHGIEICLDEVPPLGTFIEAEKLCEENADRKTVLAELWHILEQAGARKNDEILCGYDVLMRQSQGLEG